MRPSRCSSIQGLEDYLKINTNDKGIFLETAHPVKFFDVVEPVIGQTVEVPNSIKDEMGKEKKSAEIGIGLEELKIFLMKL